MIKFQIYQKNHQKYQINYELFRKNPKIHTNIQK